MRVLFLTPWYPTAAHIYAGIFVREHAKAVRAVGHEVVVIHTAGVREGLRRPWSINREMDPGLTDGIATYRVFHRRLPKRTMHPLHLIALFKAFGEIRAKEFIPDVIHAHTYGPGIGSLLLGKACGAPVVITEQFTGFPLRSLSRVEAEKARFAFHHAARVLPVSEHLRDAIRAYGVAANFEVVPNVIDTEIFFRPELTDADLERKNLLFVGNLDPNHHKGFPELVEALRLLRERRSDWQLDVVGAGPERPRYERAVAEAGLSECVSFHGQRPRREVARMMRAAHLFVLPSRFDNMPCAIIEAMASGLPVVSTRVGGIPEIVDESSGILVAPQHPAQLAAALDRVLSNLADFDRDAIATSAHSRYGLDVVGRQLDAIYHSVLSESRRSRRRT